MTLDSYIEAKKEFLSGDFSSEDFFKQNNYLLEYGYCRLLEGDVSAASAAFSQMADKDFRANWAEKLTKFIQGQIIDFPSYFQIRNFLEIDLNLLLQAGQAQFVENIIDCSNLFYSINPESYKFIARVMFNNDFVDVALYYLNKAKGKFYYDPEMHFMLANCYIKNGDKSKAKETLKNCLDVMPEYFPANKLLESL